MPATLPVFVLDAESTDTTVALARAHGATVEVRPWEGFVSARRYALSRIDTPYACMLDADEVLDATLARALLTGVGGRIGWRVRRDTQLAGRTIHTAGWSNEPLVRVFRADRARCVAASVTGKADLHERWEVDGPLGDLPGRIIHDSYPDIASYLTKFRRYTALEAASELPSFPRLLLDVSLFVPRFLWAIGRYRGWRDGWRGLVVAIGSSAYPLVVRWRALRK